MPQRKRGSRAADDPIRVTITQFGQSTAKLLALGQDVMQRPTWRSRLSSKARLMYVEAVDDDAKRSRPKAPSHYRATIYDPGTRSTLIAQGSLDGSGSLLLTESATPPPPSGDEFADAVRLV